MGLGLGLALGYFRYALYLLIFDRFSAAMLLSLCLHAYVNYLQNGNWTTRRQTSSPTHQLADSLTRRQANSPTNQLADNELADRPTRRQIK